MANRLDQIRDELHDKLSTTILNEEILSLQSARMRDFYRPPTNEPRARFGRCIAGADFNGPYTPSALARSTAKVDEEQGEILRIRDNDNRRRRAKTLPPERTRRGMGS